MKKSKLKQKIPLRRQLRHPRRKRIRRPKLTFSPTAWAQLRYLRDLGPTEVGGFGITSPDNLLGVQEFGLIGQESTEATVRFDDIAVAEFFDEQVDRGLRPEQFGRIWIHTHPGDCPRPSGVDLQTFHRCFGRCDWAVMLILARNDSTYAELRWQQAHLRLQVEIDYSQPFLGTDFLQWEQNYRERVRDRAWRTPSRDARLSEEHTLWSDDRIWIVEERP